MATVVAPSSVFFSFSLSSSTEVQARAVPEKLPLKPDPRQPAHHAHIALTQACLLRTAPAGHGMVSD